MTHIEITPPCCLYCGECHPITACPRIRAIEYYPDGKLKHIWFHTPTDGSETQTYWGGDPWNVAYFRGEG